MKLIDLRSDTVTRPSPGMLAAMARAEVGDDVFGEDPSVNQLQEKVASLLGKEAALFVPSGTMSNQIAIRTHLQPMDELICDLNCHIYQYECGAPAALSGVTCRTVEGEFGILELPQVQGLVRPLGEHLVRTRMICLENTHNRGGGRIYPYDSTAAVCGWARQQGLITHLDGARLMNAVVATNIPARQWTQHFDTVSICFSKGLGAPVGSALAGSMEFIKAARRVRKLFGGGMRQAGVLAAAASFALENNIDRLADDHLHAKRLADALMDIPGVTQTPLVPQTNILFLRLHPDLGSAHDVVNRLMAHGVLVLATAPQTIRLVTHLDVTSSQIDQACVVLRRELRKCSPVIN